MAAKALADATAPSEIFVGTIPQPIIDTTIGRALLAGGSARIKVLAGAGATLLTFLAGAKFGPVVFSGNGRKRR